MVTGPVPTSSRSLDRSPAVPTARERRQQLRQAMAAALATRNAAALQRLSSQWVHRQGVASLAPLMAELTQADPQALAWWETQMALPAQPAPETSQTLEPLQVPPTSQTPLQPEAPAPATSASPVITRKAKLISLPPGRPAPAPQAPGLASLRAWLASDAVAEQQQEQRRAA